VPFDPRPETALHCWGQAIRDLDEDDALDRRRLLKAGIIATTAGVYGLQNSQARYQIELQLTVFGWTIDSQRHPEDTVEIATVPELGAILAEMQLSGLIRKQSDRYWFCSWKDSEYDYWNAIRITPESTPIEAPPGALGSPVGYNRTPLGREQRDIRLREALWGKSSTDD
jgi:hypothetical protein